MKAGLENNPIVFLFCDTQVTLIRLCKAQIPTPRLNVTLFPPWVCVNTLRCIDALQL